MKPLIPPDGWHLIVPVISTTHVTLEDSRILDDTDIACDPSSNNWLMQTSTGWIIQIQQIPTGILGRMSPAFQNLVLLLKKSECFFIRFDSDGDVVESLPTYNW